MSRVLVYEDTDTDTVVEARSSVSPGDTVVVVVRSCPMTGQPSRFLTEYLNLAFHLDGRNGRLTVEVFMDADTGLPWSVGEMEFEPHPDDDEPPPPPNPRLPVW